MPLHDSYLRLTPLERLLPDDDFVTRHFDDFRTEAETRGVSLSDPGAFSMLDAVGRAVDDLRRPEDGAEQRHQHGLLLFHAFHMLAQDSPPTELVSTGVARWLVETATDSDSSGDQSGSSGAGSTASPSAAAPSDQAPSADGSSDERPVALLEPGHATARYVQLPQHLFWVREDPEDRPASLDGFFCTSDGEHVVFLGVMGITGPEQGFSVMTLPPLPLADVPIWLSETMRAEGEDFRSSMPGAELEGLYELTTAGEVLKLMARLDRYQRLFPESRTALEPGVPPTDASTSVPIPSRLSGTLLTLD